MADDLEVFFRRERLMPFAPKTTQFIPSRLQPHGHHHQKAGHAFLPPDGRSSSRQFKLFNRVLWLGIHKWASQSGCEYQNARDIVVEHAKFILHSQLRLPVRN